MHPVRFHHPSRGVTLIEALILVVILGLVALGVGTALQNLVRVPRATNTMLAVSNALIDKMEYLRSLPFDSLATGTSFSDTVTINGQSFARNVTIALADADANGGADADFKKITITLSGQSLVLCLTNPQP